MLAGLASIPLGLTSSGIDSGHPANALLPLLWVLAADRARRGKTLTAAVIVGLSAGVETWGILGIAVLALAPGLRSALRSAWLAAGIATAIYLPFILLGHFQMGLFEWRVSGDALMSYVVDAGTPIGWPLRFLQGGLALGAGIALAHAARRSAHLLWLVPLAVVLVRLLLDPLGNGYYFVGMEGPAIVGLALICCWGVRLPQLLLELRAQRPLYALPVVVDHRVPRRVPPFAAAHDHVFAKDALELSRQRRKRGAGAAVVRIRLELDS
jgi:hypothetical protein